MNCREVEDRIHVLLDDRSPLDSDPVLQSHMQDCESCRRMVRDYSLLFGSHAEVLNFAVQPRAASAITASNRAKWTRIAKTLCALAAVLVLFVQPAIWGWLHWDQSPRLAATGNLRTIGSSETKSAAKTTGKSTAAPIDSAIAAQEEAEVYSEINVASILDVSDAFSGLDFSRFNASEVPVVRPLAKPMNVSWNRLMQSVPNFDRSAEMQSDQMRQMQMDTNQLQMLLDSWSRFFS